MHGFYWDFMIFEVCDERLWITYVYNYVYLCSREDYISNMNIVAFIVMAFYKPRKVKVGIKTPSIA